MIEQCEGRLNSIQRVEHGGRAWWRKERGAASAWAHRVANVFFHAARNPVQVLRAAEWQRWELACFQSLHAVNTRPARMARACWRASCRGQSLSHHLREKTLIPAMLAAAGAEMRRAHAISLPEFPDGWSHGDAHLGNFIFHPGEQRARLIDFEVRHHLSLGAVERHADDLRVFLQDLVGRIGAEQWRPFALEFLKSYARPEIVVALRERLELPSLAQPFARLWWGVRTSYLPAPELRRRLAELRAAL